MSTQNTPNSGIEPPSTGSDRRRARRFSTVRSASCSPLAERDTVLPVKVRDVSPNGIGLLSTRRFERGTILLLQLEEDGDSLPPLLVGKVIHVIAQENGDWLVGCALTRALAQADDRTMPEETAQAG